MLKFSEIFEFSKEKFRKIPILKNSNGSNGSNGSVPRRSNLSTLVVRHLVMEGKPGRVGVEILPVPLVGEYCPLVGKQVAVRVEKIKLFPDYRPNPQNLAAWLARQRIRFTWLFI